MSRPTIDKQLKRVKPLQALVTESEHKKVEKYCSQLGITVSDWIRQLVLKAMSRKK